MRVETCFLSWWRALSHELATLGHQDATLGEAKGMWDACDPVPPDTAAAWVIDNREAAAL